MVEDSGGLEVGCTEPLRYRRIGRSGLYSLDKNSGCLLRLDADVFQIVGPWRCETFESSACCRARHGQVLGEESKELDSLRPS